MLSNKFSQYVNFIHKQIGGTNLYTINKVEINNIRKEYELVYDYINTNKDISNEDKIFITLFLHVLANSQFHNGLVNNTLNGINYIYNRLQPRRGNTTLLDYLTFKIDEKEYTYNNCFVSGTYSTRIQYSNKDKTQFYELEPLFNNNIISMYELSKQYFYDNGAPQDHVKLDHKLIRGNVYIRQVTGQRQINKDNFTEINLEESKYTDIKDKFIKLIKVIVATLFCDANKQIIGIIDDFQYIYNINNNIKINNDTFTSLIKQYNKQDGTNKFVSCILQFDYNNNNYQITIDFSDDFSL